MMLVRFPPPASWEDALNEHEQAFDRLDDQMDAAALQDRRELLDRIAEPAQITDEAALTGGSFWLNLLALGAGIATLGVLGVLAYVLVVNPAHGADMQPGDMQMSTREVVTVPACTEAFKDLPRIAARLGVPVLGEVASGTVTVVLHMCNGDRYDFIALINATLDRLDRANR